MAGEAEQRRATPRAPATTQARVGLAKSVEPIVVELPVRPRPGGVTADQWTPPSFVNCTAWRGACTWLPVLTVQATAAPTGVKSWTPYGTARASATPGVVPAVAATTPTARRSALPIA